MSTQTGTLSHHKTVQVPMWLIVALVVGMLAIAIGYTVEQYQRQEAVATSAVTTIPDTQVAAREGGAVFPATVLAPVFRGGLETSGVMRAAAVGSSAAVLFPGALETSGVMRAAAVAREGTSPQTRPEPEPIVVNGQICHQCR
jgi:hypothetical protein